MIPRSPLLFLHCPRQRHGDNTATATASTTASASASVPRGRTPHEPKQLPPALRLKRVAANPPAAPAPFFFLFRHPRAPFWEQQQQQQQQQQRRSPRLAFGLRRTSGLFGVLLALASFATVDDYNLLPAGTLLYTVALTMAWENWTDEAEEHRRLAETIRMYRARMETIEREVQKARFEYHVLQNKPHVDIVALRRRRKKGKGGASTARTPLPPPPPPSSSSSLHGGQSRDSEEWIADDDHWIVYADDRKQTQKQKERR
eukprot:jgi/Psemu1/8827/gm1.8827_g